MKRQLGISCAVVIAAALASSPGAHAQDDAGLRASAVLSIDTARVGEPFIVGVIVASADSVAIPPLLASDEGWEQLELARFEVREGETRAYYRLVAWEAGRIQLPDLSVAAGGREYSVTLPAPVVQSVLPAGQQVLLQPPRPPLGSRAQWALLLAGLVLLGLGLWWMRMRNRPVEAVIVEAQTPDALLVAREALVELRRKAAAEALAADGFYDHLEQILRGYVVGSKSWSAALPMRASRLLDEGAMRAVQHQATLARFAAVGWPTDRLVSDADASLAWLTEEES
jgi:hypothetical protein